MKFESEAGTGLGPTQEFFTLLGEAISSAGDDKMWIVDPLDGTLFPNPIDNKALTPEKIKEVTDVFYLAGAFTAKAILDNVLFNLPISPLMWDLLLGKVSLYRLFSVHIWY